MTRQKAIARYCFECAGDSRANHALCVLTDCPLWPFRLGVGPKAHNARVAGAWERLQDWEKENMGRDYGLDAHSFKYNAYRGARKSKTHTAPSQDKGDN